MEKPARHPAKGIGYRQTVLRMAAFAAAGIVLITGISRASDTPSVVIIRQTATVKGDRICLTDLLDSPVLPAPGARAHRRCLLDAPEPGKERVLPGQWVASFIRSNGWLPQGAELTVPEQVRVKRAYQTVAETDLEKYFYDTIAAGAQETEFGIRDFKVHGAEKFPVGRLEFAPTGPEPRKMSGRVTLRLEVTVDGKACGGVTLSGWIDRYETVVCAGRYLPRGTILETDDLQSQRMNLSRVPFSVVKAMEDAVGKRLKSSIRAGRYIRLNMLSVPPLIEKGEQVKIVAQRGNMKIVTFGIAKGSGGRGEQIELENLTSQKTVVGRVKDASTVEVLF